MKPLSAGASIAVWDDNFIHLVCVCGLDILSVTHTQTQSDAHLTDRFRRHRVGCLNGDARKQHGRASVCVRL